MRFVCRPPRQVGVTILLLAMVIWHAEAVAGQLSVSWVDPYNDQLGFSVERGIGPVGPFGEIGTTAAGVTAYTDPSVSTGTTYCYRVRAFNTAGYSDYSNVACGASVQMFGLAVVKMGAGGGTVTSSPVGIICGTSCSGTYPSGTLVTLTAVPTAGSSFTGWSGGGCAGTGFCTVTLTATTTVTASFEVQSVSLTVSKGGTGGGTITSSPGGIACGATCSGSYASGTAVTLSAAPASGSSFTGWSGGGCSGTGSCTVTLTATTTVTATFTASPTTFALAVTKAGTGSGAVTSSPTAINCGTTCSASFASGTAVTLTATPAIGSSFAGWSGACSGTGACSVSMNAATTVTATFTASPTTFALVVTKAGTGSGAVTSSPTAINCGTTCSASFASGTTVTLTAIPAVGSSFVGWSGACSGAGGCSVGMNAATTVTATFTASPTTFALAVTKAGTGSGAVTSSPTAINCGTTCSASFTSGTAVTLTATPATGSTFTGWSGGGCSGTGICPVTLTAAMAVTATFDLATPRFTDDFQRPDSTVLGNGWTVPLGNFSIRAGQLRNGTNKMRHLAVQASRLMAAGGLTIEFTSVNNNEAPSFGLVFGYRDPLNYHAAYRQVGGSSLLKIVRVVNGVEVVIAHQACPNPVPGQNFQIAVSFAADRIVMTAAGRSVTASAVTVSPGGVGLMVKSGGSSHIADNFTATP